jgi:hypothetical protein
MVWIVVKTARAGRLIWSLKFEDKPAIAKHLKCSLDIVEDIIKHKVFPKGKTCVFNKYYIREEVQSDKPPEDRFTISFD